MLHVENIRVDGLDNEYMCPHEATVNIGDAMTRRATRIPRRCSSASLEDVDSGMSLEDHWAWLVRVPKKFFLVLGVAEVLPDWFCNPVL